MLFRNLFLLIAVIALLWIVKGMIRRSSKAPSKNNQIKDMVQCQLCQSYSPKDDAVFNNGHVFCSQKHLDDWKTKH